MITYKTSTTMISGSLWSFYFNNFIVYNIETDVDDYEFRLFKTASGNKFVQVWRKYRYSPQSSTDTWNNSILLSKEGFIWFLANVLISSSGNHEEHDIYYQHFRENYISLKNLCGISGESGMMIDIHIDVLKALDEKIYKIMTSLDDLDKLDVYTEEFRYFVNNHRKLVSIETI